jgi:hypothetical protein
MLFTSQIEISPNERIPKMKKIVLLGLVVVIATVSYSICSKGAMNRLRNPCENPAVWNLN